MNRPFFILFAFFCLFSVSCCSDNAPPSTSQRKWLITAEDFFINGDNSSQSIVSSAEKLIRSRYPDGTIKYEYEYSPDKSESIPQNLYIRNSMYIEKNSERAHALFIADNSALSFIESNWNVNGLILEDFPVLGDESWSLILLDKENGQPVGNFFVIRLENIVHIVILAGVYILEPDDWQTIISPKLTATKEEFNK